MQHKWTPLALGFRPFFLLSICFAILLMLVSLAIFSTGMAHYNYFTPALWHGHEMVFGYAVAVIAGFLLTAVRNWTGLPTPAGKALALLVVLWLTPRLLSAAAFLPPAAYALLDMLFLPVLAIVLGRVILKAKQPHNYPVPLLLLLLSLCNAALHLDMLGFAEGVAVPAIQLAVTTCVALIVLIAGRVVPFFMQGGIGTRPVANKWIEKLALPSVLLFALAVITPYTCFITITALIAAFIHGIRLISWFDRAILCAPMLWILHAGYASVVAGFILYALSSALDIAPAQAIHAWTVGAIGLFTLGMMTRVALGHTGRPIQPLPWIPAAFILLLVAAFIRVILPLVWPNLMASAIFLSAMCWITAFVIVAIRYTFILLQPRADGKPG
ncbi:MAG: NnrS family protein [Mariprofundus sp.]